MSSEPVGRPEKTGYPTLLSRFKDSAEVRCYLLNTVKPTGHGVLVPEVRRNIYYLEAQFQKMRVIIPLPNKVAMRIKKDSI